MKYGSSPLSKGVMVAVVALLLLIPVEMLRSLVNERAQLREQAVASVSRGWGGRQLLGGPIIAVPATLEHSDGRRASGDWYVLPDSLELNAQLTVQEQRRRLGVYEVPVYLATVRAVASFDVAARVAALTAAQRGVTLHLDRARLLLPVSDARGVRAVTLSDASITAGDFEPVRGFPLGTIGAPLRAGAELQNGVRRIEIALDVAGTESLRFLPFARSTQVKLAGNWAHPGFTRGFLPTEREIRNRQFSARWQVLDLNRAYGSHWFQEEVGAVTLEESAFGIDLVQPVDLYQRAERSVKYAGLFVALSLLTLFLWEHLAGRALHPIQYGLMGLALSMFYLLLLALAEHIGFDKAYAVAAASLCLLLGVYISGAFDSGKAGSGSGVAFGAVYALLYLLVTSEDYSLLAGAVGLFAVLAVVMVVTRRIDWYRSRVTPEESDRASRR